MRQETLIAEGMRLRRLTQRAMDNSVPHLPGAQDVHRRDDAGDADRRGHASAHVAGHMECVLPVVSVVLMAIVWVWNEHPEQLGG